jgi:ankyrin repeat protein
LNKINKMSQLSGIKDVDREILSKLDDRELLKTCSIDKYTWGTVCDDAFLRRRLLSKYSEIEQYKSEEESWKKFFLRAIYYISKMKEEYEYNYSFGDFKKQYDILSRNIYYKNDKPDPDNVFIDASRDGEMALVMWSLKNGANIHEQNDLAIIIASGEGRTEIVKYLVEHGADIAAVNYRALRLASIYGHLETVKYLVELGADIHNQDDDSLKYASKGGHLEVVKYLLEKGANIHAQNDAALLIAVTNNRLNVVKYLLEKGANIHAQNDEALKIATRRNFSKIADYLKSKM